MILEKIKELEELVIYLNASDKSVVSKAINFSNKASLKCFKFCSIFKKLLKILSLISESISSIGGETSVIYLPDIFRLISPCFPDQRRWAMSPEFSLTKPFERPASNT